MAFIHYLTLKKSQCDVKIAFLCVYIYIYIETADIGLNDLISIK